MSLVRFLLLVAGSTVMSWAAWILVLTTLDPQSGLATQTLFFGSLGLALIGTGTVINFYVRHWFERQAVPFRQLHVALRQSTLVTIGLLVGLGLQAARWLTWWSVLLLVGLVIIIEIFFQVGEADSPRATTS